MPSEIDSETPQDATEVHSPRAMSAMSRANGAKSRGPATAAGRARSSRNSIRHGLRAKTVVLPTESARDYPRDYQCLLESYIDHFQPATGVENDLLLALAAARWRLHRI